ncbi:hypothetical protein REPUB_Repub13aG0131700 [Reevesia pubescens]
MVRPCTWKRLSRKTQRNKGSEQPKVLEKETITTKEAAVAPSMSSTSNSRQNIPPPRVIFIFENASLKKGYVGKKRKLLNSDEDHDFLRKQGKNVDDYRPDIVLEVLKEIFDSRLNDNDRVGAIYVKTDEGFLFEIKPHVRIPRTHERFYGVMLELLEKKRVKIPETNEVLIQELKGPLTQHLPSNSRVIGLSYNAEKVININDYLSTIADDVTPVFLVGAMVRGKVNKAGTDDYISISNYPLSAAYSTALVCIALANKWELH